MEDLASNFNEKAEKLKKDRKFEEALKLTDKVQEIQKEQRDSDYWYKRGMRFAELGEYEKALDCYNKDLTIHEKSYTVFLERGKILLQLKKFAEALESFNKAAEIRNQHFLQYTKKAHYLKNSRRFEKALLYTDNAMNENILDELFWYYKGMALLKLKKYNDAYDCFEKSIEIKKDATCMYDLAKCLLLLGDEEKSIDILRKIQNQPGIKEKLKIDLDFASIEDNKQFRMIVGL